MTHTNERTHAHGTGGGAAARGTGRPAFGSRWPLAAAALAAGGALLLAGCSGSGDSGDGKSMSAERGFAAGQGAGDQAGAPGAGEAAAPAPAAGASGQPVQLRQHVIRTATLSVEAEDPQRALAAARKAAEGAGGHVGSESTRRSRDGRVTSTVTLRVPGERFDAVLGELEGGGKLLHRKVGAEDVTERVVDVDSRVRSQQASVARVRDMMEKATALSDVVMLEGELSKRQSELESLLAQQSALKDRTSLATIELEVSEPGEGSRQEEDPGFLDALRGGWDAFTGALGWLALAVGAVLPFAVTAALLVLVWRVVRRLRRGPAGPAPEAPAASPAGADPAEVTDTASRITG
ncbi:DUF4349 domain-containing protein [Streptomyces sp. NPDC012888]|uniref:DUF4349 domain-containing protein n=1 Tax=Streptomyces sp. NPDC012888 TaxID=3364855 RepID=UPI0036B18BC0